MTERLKKIFSHIDDCKVFADIGCDHGYIAKAMIKSGKCQKVIISDISAKCLQKAVDLLSDEIEKGKAVGIVSNGFEKLPPVDLALIAGMGGEEIISIMDCAKSLPDKLVLQPMKNLDKVRKLCVEKGYKIILDYVFFEGGKFYDLIKLERGKDSLSLEEIEFGRTNLLERSKAFKDRLNEDIKKLKVICQDKNIKEDTLLTLKKRIENLEKYV